MSEWVNKIRTKWMKLRWQPIRVFCFHQVSEVFDEESMWECDWMSTNDFKSKIEALGKEYTFISLPDAYIKLKYDTFRFKKYAVLTADDGSKTLENVLPWLKDKKIPITLFMNGSCLDGKTYRISPNEKYYTKEEIIGLTNPLITIGHHGWEHKDIRTFTESEFRMSIKRNTDALDGMPHLIPFWAYPYGTHVQKSDAIVRENGLIPVTVDRTKNYFYNGVIHRELL